MLTYNMVLAAAAQAGDSLAAEQWFNKMTEEQPPFFWGQLQRVNLRI